MKGMKMMRFYDDIVVILVQELSWCYNSVMVAGRLVDGTESGLMLQLLYFDFMILNLG